MAAFSAIMRGMNILLSIAITTGILSGIWGWVAVSTELTKLGGLLGCTAYFACPQGGLKGLAISAATLLSGVVWAMVIIYGSALAPHLEILGYVITYCRVSDVYSGQTAAAFICSGDVYRRMRDVCRAG